MAKATDSTEFISELGGSFQHVPGQIISNVAEAVVATGKQGTISIDLNLKRIGESRQVNITHKLAFKEPTAKGSRSEDTSSETPMHVNLNGTVSMFAQKTDIDQLSNV